MTARWIIGPRSDVLWILGGLLAGYALFFAHQAFRIDLLAVWFGWMLALDGPHVFATWSRTYLLREEWGRRPGLLLSGLALAGLPAAVLLLSRPSFYALLAAVNLWGFWHVRPPARGSPGALPAAQRRRPGRRAVRPGAALRGARGAVRGAHDAASRGLRGDRMDDGDPPRGGAGGRGGRRPRLRRPPGPSAAPQRPQAPVPWAAGALLPAGVHEPVHPVGAAHGRNPDPDDLPRPPLPRDGPLLPSQPGNGRRLACGGGDRLGVLLAVLGCALDSNLALGAGLRSSVPLREACLAPFHGVFLHHYFIDGFIWKPSRDPSVRQGLALS